LKYIREGLYQVVNNPKGTAFYRRGKGILMAGKTGTSQVVRSAADKVYQKCEQMEYEYRHHGLFVAFAPANNPRIAAAAMVEHGCHGSSAAAPIVEAVITTYMQKYHPDEYLKNLEFEKEMKTQTPKVLAPVQEASDE
jgi:penicillin-binding protein 2